MADLRIDLAAEFVGKKAFKDADNAAVRLDKTVKQLGKTLGITLGASAMAAYGKAAVKAFAEDEAAARRLSSAVDNLGLSFSKVQVADFISSLEQSAAISDDILRPSFQSLLNITGSLTKSQELLSNAIQISRASGVDLATVTTDLGKGYVGITRGLIKYNTGLTRAELQTKSFNEILGVMLAKSAGAAQDYLTTTSFKLDTLRVSSERAKESIGEGLVNAFAVLGGGSQASDAAKTIDNIAKGINAITMATAQAVNGLRLLYKGLDFLTTFGGITGGDGALVRRFDQAPTVSSGRSASPAGTAIRTRQQRDAEAAAAKRAKEVAIMTKKEIASTKALIAEQKKQSALKKAGTLFDLDQIQIIAALKGKLSVDDRRRLELQLALATENLDEVEKLSKQLAVSQGLGMDLAKFLASLPSAKNPFEAWKDILDGIEKQAARIAGMQFDMANFKYTVPTGNFTYGQGNPLNTDVFVDPRGATGGSTVVVNVAGSVTTSQSLVDEIRGGLNVAALSGSSANVERRIGGW
jgi:ribosomal protein S18